MVAGPLIYHHAYCLFLPCFWPYMVLFCADGPLNTIPFHFELAISEYGYIKLKQRVN